MHKISRPVMPNGYTEACCAFNIDYPPADSNRTETKRWAAFKNEQQAMYANIKEVLFANQQGLCAFCECELKEGNREIEHFMPKSLTTSSEDWTLNFDNYSLSCRGGAKPDDHCGHLKDDIDPRGEIICPYDLPEKPLIRFEIIDNSVRILPDVASCRAHNIDVALVQLTIDNLGLNCKTLRKARYDVWLELEVEVDDILKGDFSFEEQDEELQIIVESQTSVQQNILKPFITTRKIFLNEKLPDLYQYTA